MRSGEQLTLGERAADRMRNTMGSWPFVFGFFAVMIIWAIINSGFYLGGTHGKHGFDPYPYILLNLFLSMLAGVQAAASSPGVHMFLSSAPGEIRENGWQRPCAR